MISADLLNKIFKYENGKLYWKEHKRGRKINKQVGHLSNTGYLQACIDYHNYSIHRLVFLMHNEYLQEFVDHINGNKVDNRIENLREATASQSQHNKTTQKNNTTGYKGVSLFKRTGKYRARVKINGKEVNLGYFDTAQEAAEQRREAVDKIHGEYANHGGDKCYH